MNRLPLARETLANGLELVLVPLPHLHTVTVIFAVKAGARYEAPSKNGISHVLEHMMFRGSRRFPSARALNLAIEELGGQLDATTHVDFTTYELTLPPESLEEGLDRFAEVLLAPLFLDLELEKKILKEELLEDLDEDGVDVNVDNLSRRLLFRDHGLGQTITGTIDGILALTEKDLREFLAHHYVGANSVIAVAGPFEPGRLAQVLARCFGGLPRGHRTVPNTPVLDGRGERFGLVRDPGTQCHVRMSFHAYGESHPDGLALDFLARTLDDGMGSRLHHRLRDQLGMAYDSFAGIDPYEDCGVFDLGASVEHGKLPELLKELHTLARGLRDADVSAEELERVHKRYLWDLVATLDDAHNTALWHATRTLFGVRESFDVAEARAKSVTADDVRRVAADVFRDENVHVAVVGDPTGRVEDKARGFVEGLGGPRGPIVVA